jgi:hypothetical protein
VSNPLQFGNKELSLPDFQRLVTLAGPIGEGDCDDTAIYLAFERETYTRAEVLELLQIVARMEPDECEMSDGDLRLWWD